MNKVFAFGEVGKRWASKHEEFISKAKEALIDYFGKKREGSICSTLDFSDYVWFDREHFKGKSKSIRLDELYNSELWYYLRNTKTLHNRHLVLLDSHIHHLLNFLATYTIPEDRASNACAQALVGMKNAALLELCVLPIGGSNVLCLHELLHTISTKVVRVKQGDEVGYSSKVGLQLPSNKGQALNEIFTEYLAQLVAKKMEKNGRSLMEGEIQTEGSGSTYKNYFPLIEEFFKKFKEPLIDSYFGDDISAINLAVGKENFDNLLTAFDNLFNFDEEKGYNVKVVLALMQSETGGFVRSMSLAANGISVENFNKYTELITEINSAIDRCVEYADKNLVSSKVN